MSGNAQLDFARDTNNQIIQELGKVMELPEKITRLSLHLNLDTLPSVELTYLPEEFGSIEEVQQKFTLVPEECNDSGV